MARAHYENFPVASRLVPGRMRPHVAALYAFARAADDFADEPAHDGRRLEAIDRWEARLDRCLAGEADHPVFVALSETIRRFELPDRLLRDLLDAFRQDCRVGRYDTWDELLDYCRRSANPVGRLVLILFGYRGEEEAALSDRICSALQLTNFWQDVPVDLRKDRIYLPTEDRLRFGVTENDLREGRLHEGLRRLLGEVVARTRRLYAEGLPLLGRTRGRLRLELRMVWIGGHLVLDRIERRGFDVFGARPALTRLDRVSMLVRSLLGRWVAP